SRIPPPPTPTTPASPRRSSTSWKRRADMTDKIRVGFGGDFQVKEIVVAPGDPVPWDPSRKYSILGSRVPRVDGKAKATGGAKYSIDMRLPGMLYARILRCPLAAATVTSVDLS